MNTRKVYFCFADPAGFSGQKAALEIIINGLRCRGWHCVRKPQPVLNREGNSLVSYARYLYDLIVAWICALPLLISRRSWVIIALGQTRMSFIRDAIPIIYAFLGMKRQRIVISLHGSPFMHWGHSSLDVCVFTFLIKRAGTITVVGERQRARLISLGVSGDRVVVMVNTCVLEGVSLGESRTSTSATVKLLYLSSLIDTKGYPDYLNALALLSNRPGAKVEGVLCGKIVISEFAERFLDVNSAEIWIEEIIAMINCSDRVRISWVRGAKGEEKTKLFEEADIFVLPTRYAVEAQPLVLLEAMATGCAILTTRVGEIETILDENSARFLDIQTPESLANILEEMIADAGLRRRLALNAAKRFRECYALEKHLDSWEYLLYGVAKH